MAMDALIGRVVRLVIADPWELVGADGTNEVKGTIRRVAVGNARDLAELELDEPLAYGDARHGRDE
jgi:hypothetical protein